MSTRIRPNGQVENWLALAPECVQRGAADKGYGSDALLEPYRTAIPPRSGQSRACDGFIDKGRHLIECFFNKIKHYRRIFSRFQRLARNYPGFLRFAPASI
ncbi:transposase [Methylobacter sp. BlB1]|nr:transposase [Methylobacter sp. BlB1]